MGLPRGLQQKRPPIAIPVHRCLTRVQIVHTTMDRRRSTGSIRPFVPVVLFLTTVLLSLSTSEATIEGDTLFAMMQKWNVRMPGWVAGGDPCAQNWTYQNVRCRGGHVVYLNMTNTGISGDIPAEIGDLVHLEHLDLSNVYNKQTAENNTLTGTFPDSMANLKKLKSFNGSNIREWGIEFPMVLTQFSELEELQMSATQLYGTFPDEFFTNLPALRILFIGNNKLKGDLRKFVQFKNIEILSLYQSYFYQMIPDELSTLRNLEYFNCHTCGLYGPLPESFSKLQNLHRMRLYNNNLTGPIPYVWKNMKNMRDLRMNQNYLNGNFPTWMFTEWPNLNILLLDKNSLSGSSPNFTELEVKYNVTYTYTGLTWNCNYLSGFTPCPTFNSCSSETIEKIYDQSFGFTYNCYGDASQRDFTFVSLYCGVNHPSDVQCEDFYQNQKAGGCPRCPFGQVPWPGNNRQCVCTLKPHKGARIGVGAVVGGATGLVVVFIILLALILYKRREHFPFLDRFIVKRHRGSDEAWEVPPGVERFSKQEITRMTKDFNDDSMIGQGGFGKVFLGTLPDGKLAAIKRASTSSLQGIYEFHNEITVLSRVHHRNLVRLYGFCDEDDCQILVYEYVTRGNLHTHLAGKSTTTPLHWYRRLEIAYGVARGLEYLHTYANPPVIHRDVKPSNILLDDEMEAKLADFGISKIHPELETHVSTRPAGTAGYLDPDYFMRRQLTTASDIYAFGVVLLELVTGQEAIDHSRMEEFNLIEWVKKRFKTSGIVSIVDPHIENEYVPNIYSEMARLGLECASFNRNDRPSIQTVLAVLDPLIDMRPLYTDGSSSKKDGKRAARRDANKRVDSISIPVDLEHQRSYPRRQSILDVPDDYPVTRALLDSPRRFLDTISPGGASDTVRSISSNASNDGPNMGFTELARIVTPR